jgi:hypothetical protein
MDIVVGTKVNMLYLSDMNSHTIKTNNQEKNNLPEEFTKYN